MKRIILAIIFCLLAVSAAQAFFFRAFTSLTGETSGSVDNIDCADVYGSGASTDDGIGVVITSGGDVYFYYFDQSATNATSSPDYIRCKNYATSGVWILADTVSGALTSGADCFGITSGICLDTDDGKLYSWDGDSVELAGVLDFQPLDSDLTSIAALTTDTYGRALLAIATELAFQQYVNLEIGVDTQAYHANLAAVADAAAGVATPGVTLYDSNSLGADKTTAFYGADTTTLTDGAEDSDLLFKSMEGGTLTQRAMFDQSDGQWEFGYPIVAPSIDAGMLVDTLTLDGSDIDLSAVTICRKNWSMPDTAGSDEITTLASDPRCNATDGIGKLWCFQNTDGTYDLDLEPGGTNKIFFEGASCGDGNQLYLQEEGDSVCLLGTSSVAWQVISATSFSATQSIVCE